ncbi:hypothetical protein GCM10027456_40280 [Kineosporia babensis]
MHHSPSARTDGTEGEDHLSPRGRQVQALIIPQDMQTRLWVAPVSGTQITDLERLARERIGAVVLRAPAAIMYVDHEKRCQRQKLN